MRTDSIRSHSATILLSNIVLSVYSPQNQLETNAYFRKNIARTRSAMKIFQMIKAQWSNLPLVNQFFKMMSIGSSIKHLMAYVNPPIIGLILLRRLLSLWASPPHHMTPGFFLVYLPTPIIQPAIQTYNNKFISYSMSMTLYFNCLVHTRSNYSKPCFKKKSKCTAWEM